MVPTFLRELRHTEYAYYLILSHLIPCVKAENQMLPHSMNFYLANMQRIVYT